jgi:hypothetical protein
MPMFRLPLKLPFSGDVTQSILPWTWLFNPVGSQVGLVNIEMGRSANPEVEQEVLKEVASYGRQLGRLEDALLALVAAYRDKREFTPDEEKKIAALATMVDDINAVKARLTKDTVLAA